jgi:hypothetical protein
MEVGGQRHAQAKLPSGKAQYPLYRRLGGPQSRSGGLRKISPPPGSDPRTVQPVASRYTDCAIPAPTQDQTSVKFIKIDLWHHSQVWPWMRRAGIEQQVLFAPARAKSEHMSCFLNWYMLIHTTLGVFIRCTFVRSISIQFSSTIVGST